ncbi:hypothetical protein [Oceanisphaera ostreae]|uniref:Uncharacterized protein n=1 Tax=Oceanisphaera ostreae TaxID=914151 RepID=A0ABW3KJP3_9GAMM
MSKYILQYLFNSEITGEQRKMWQDEAAKIKIVDYTPLGVVTEIPPELAEIDDSDPLCELRGLHIWERPASRYKQRFTDAIKRQEDDKFNPDDIAQILSEQQGKDVDFFMEKIREGFAKSWLKFYFQDGSPADYITLSDGYPMPYEYYLGLDQEYSTREDINVWLERWGAKYRFLDGHKQPTEKKGIQQQRLILEELEKLGHNPQKLPKKDKGNSWIKSEVRKTLDNKYPFEARTAFNSAWKELLALKRIKEANK